MPSRHAEQSRAGKNHRQTRSLLLPAQQDPALKTRPAPCPTQPQSTRETSRNGASSSLQRHESTVEKSHWPHLGTQNKGRHFNSDRSNKEMTNRRGNQPPGERPPMNRTNSPASPRHSSASSRWTSADPAARHHGQTKRSGPPASSQQPLRGRKTSTAYGRVSPLRHNCRLDHSRNAAIAVRTRPEDGP